MRLHPARLAIAAVALLSALPVAAGSFRCGSRLVRDGDPAADVLAKCGQPAQISKRLVLRPPMVWRYGRLVRAAGGDIETQVETWLYNFGPTRLMQQVQIENGVVTKVETLGYGHR